MDCTSIHIPLGRMSANTDDKAAEEQRKRIAEMLRRGETVTISQEGVLHAPNQAQSPSAGNGRGRTVHGDVELVVPSGKLA